MKIRSLLEDPNVEQLNKIAAQLSQECEPYLSQLSDIENARLYRGVKSNEIIHKLTPETNRQPTESSIDIHKQVDAWLMKNYGIAGRSQAVFATGDKSQAKSFGVAYSFFPIGPFSYVWSESVHDLLSLEKDLKNKTEQEIDQILSERNYRTDNLNAAIQSGNEVMVKCESYYLVRDDIIEDLLYYRGL